MTSKSAFEDDPIHCKVLKAGDSRQITDGERQKLLKDTTLVTEFKRNKYELEAQKNWDKFYKRNTTKFFKDRHWTKREFEDLCGKMDGGRRVLLEVGCGVGNFIWPLLEEEDHLFVYACDFSPRAVQFVKEHDLYDGSRVQAFQCDIVNNDLGETVSPGSVDIVSMIFVLSSIHPDKMPAAVHNVYKVLRPGGCVLLRDYGLYDHAMLRFAPGHKLADNFYVRQDGTRAYYFTLEYLAGLFEEAGFKTEDNEYVLRDTINRKEGLCVPRIFVQAKFIKPSQDVPQGSTSKETVKENSGDILSDVDISTVRLEEGSYSHCNCESHMTSPDAAAAHCMCGQHKQHKSKAQQYHNAAEANASTIYENCDRIGETS